MGAARVYNPNLKTYLDNKLFEKELLTGGTGQFHFAVWGTDAEDLKKIPFCFIVVDNTEDVSRLQKIVFSGIQPSGRLAHWEIILGR